MIILLRLWYIHFELKPWYNPWKCDIRYYTLSKPFYFLIITATVHAFLLCAIKCIYIFQVQIDTLIQPKSRLRSHTTESDFGSPKSTHSHKHTTLTHFDLDLFQRLILERSTSNETGTPGWSWDCKLIIEYRDGELLFACRWMPQKRVELKSVSQPIFESRSKRRFWAPRMSQVFFSDQAAALHFIKLIMVAVEWIGWDWSVE